MQSKNGINEERQSNFNHGGLCMELSRTLYKVFVIENRYDILSVADSIGKSPSWIYKVCEGKIRPSWCDVRRLLRFTRDIEIAQTIVGSDFVVLTTATDQYRAGYNAARRDVVKHLTQDEE